MSLKINFRTFWLKGRRIKLTRGMDTGVERMDASCVSYGKENPKLR